jgi:hypothetical protein
MDGVGVEDGDLGVGGGVGAGDGDEGWGEFDAQECGEVGGGEEEGAALAAAEIDEGGVGWERRQEC